ncbi:DUF4249 domain-containing protein [Zunongwangia sp. F363]|uniref:DUF4249 domain-containing protein n=1 Tax=Autumnicola tepida TaxID=3075595 RepID=A0ABU3CDT2_9FLAO|nr:DUF4249 domain-containing protein [Zunongwangia sp. F363]MDT0644513.1 DUF4249 domain-containing protein [Zunongwangia sp. F363]
MKKLGNLFLLFIVFMLIYGCEDVVEIELEESEPRLVVEASIEWLKNTGGNFQSVKLSTTSGYYEEEAPAVTNAQVKIIDEAGKVFNFEHTSDGIYQNNNFEPQLNMEYQLEIKYEDEVYTAQETLIPVVNLDFVEHTSSGGFEGEQVEIKAYYTDPADEVNFYMFTFRDEKATFEIYEDEFTNGNQIFGYYSNEDIEPGDEIYIELAGISRSYYEYLFILRSQIGTNAGGPFETRPATVKGNIINQSNRSNYALGYFRLSQVVETDYVVD